MPIKVDADEDDGQLRSSADGAAAKGHDDDSSSDDDAVMDASMVAQRKQLFGDCALIEIIHLHDCLRGALKQLEKDVKSLTKLLDCMAVVQHGATTTKSTEFSKDDGTRWADLERRVAGRFKVIWSVFRAHSSAEDEFIWPALQRKTQGRIRSHAHGDENDNAFMPLNAAAEFPVQDDPPEVRNDAAAANDDANDNNDANDALPANNNVVMVEQEEYEEDHADEERMFGKMDTMLLDLRRALVQGGATRTIHGLCNDTTRLERAQHMAHDICTHTRKLSHHLMQHLGKEETQCLPLVVQHLSKTEIHELVGQIMGKRSADTIAQIMNMAVQSLDVADRVEMMRYMKQSMADTFFDRWLQMSGWGQEGHEELSANCEAGVDDRKRPAAAAESEEMAPDLKRPAVAEYDSAGTTAGLTSMSNSTAVGITSQAELEKLIRAIATNPALSNEQKNTTIQGLRDSVWKSNQRERQRQDMPQARNDEDESAEHANQMLVHPGPAFIAHRTATVPTRGIPAPSSGTLRNSRRVTPPSMYFRKNVGTGRTELVWSADTSASSGPARPIMPSDLPLFSASELAPTFHDGAAGAVLGCPHYACACKLRHPKSGRLYTCRLCCDQQRELPHSVAASADEVDEPLDRYEVSEIMCMKCNSLQPAEDRCLNRDCESHGKPFARYFCRICHLYDDGSRPIFHCPYCNICRLGLGLGIDFRHCMRCNACVSLEDNDHRCIPQKLQGSCPICHEQLFQSTEPLRGLKCGHVMHLQCFTDYKRSHSYTCPLCMRSMEDMADYFALLDTAVRMQPMPPHYWNTRSNIYCQDCGQTGSCTYHFVGQKCPHCGSYNTRELGRFHESPPSSPLIRATGRST